MKLERLLFYKKMKRKNTKGFTLVELLIVIALIAILSVAVLATINPIEQANKARDAKVQNDAAEVMNAYERYYAGKTSYPWVDVVTPPPAGLTVDAEFFATSNDAGFGLCGNATATDPLDACTSSTTAGLVVTTQELKNSFLNKGYTRLATDTGYTFVDELYLVKQDNTFGNSIYVCYIPKANANRQNTAGSTVTLKNLAVDGLGRPTQYVDATPAEVAAATYLTAATSLFRCVPE